MSRGRTGKAIEGNNTMDGTLAIQQIELAIAPIHLIKTLCRRSQISSTRSIG